MRIQWTKVFSKLVLFFVILVGWAGVSQAQWTALNSTPGVVLDTCLLLTDGTVMCHQTNSNRWHRLTPDINGSYVNGTWSNLADMPNGTDTSVANPNPPPNVTGPCAPCTYSPKYFASQVLPDGRVVIIGGEYNSNGNTWTNIGFLFDPAANGGMGSWSAQLTEPFGTGSIGDAQSVVLPTGTMLLANINGTNTNSIASFNPNTLTFTALNPNPTGKQDRNDEENWNILPDGTILTVDSGRASQFEIYDPIANSWTFGATPVNLGDAGAGSGNSDEIGPAVLRPDGTLIYFSGNPAGQNAVYDTATGNWTHTAQMDFPCLPTGPGCLQYSVADGPASLLPNGNVLVMASPPIPGSAGFPFNPPSHFFEFDGTNLTQVADGPNAASLISFQGRFLLLPSGEVLFTSEPNTGVSVYSNGGSPQDGWRPVITSAPANVNAGNTYGISGKMFNGFSEGASYGDDAQMSTNYPLVRIINHATGHVFYARTHDHSRMGVERVGSNEIVTTQFDAPAGIESGASDLVVVANGIASQPIVINGPDLAITKTHAPALFTQGDSGDTFSISVTNTGNSPVSRVVTVTDTLPGSLTATAINGTGWSCTLGTLTCIRSDTLASYPPIVVTVDVANNAPILVTNTATVSGGGEASTINLTGNNTATDNVNVRQHTFTTVDAATQDYHDDVTLRATVAPTGVAGSVTFFIDGVNVGVASYSSVTGVATLVYNITQIPGLHTILAAFTSADILYLDSSGTNTLTVTKEETTLSYAGDTVIANGGTATMSGVLLEDGLVPIAGRTVTFTLGSGGSAQTCNGVTNASGIATCNITPVAQPLGPGVVGDVFAGDAFYLPSSASANTIVFAFLVNGAFAIGDLNAPIGTSVTFWSAQWPALNSLSSGAAPPSFKGLASTLTAEPPNCGIAWTTGPGNNSDPPDLPLPSYMGILVSTRIVKSGSTVSGDVLSIVVVKTDTGYRPNPGHAGTGIVVAQFCHR